MPTAPGATLPVFDQGAHSAPTITMGMALGLGPPGAGSRRWAGRPTRSSPATAAAAAAALACTAGPARRAGSGSRCRRRAKRPHCQAVQRVRPGACSELRPAATTMVHSCSRPAVCPCAPEPRPRWTAVAVAGHDVQWAGRQLQGSCLPDWAERLVDGAWFERSAALQRQGKL